MDQGGSGGCEDVGGRATGRADGLGVSWEGKRSGSRMSPALGLSSWKECHEHQWGGCGRRTVDDSRQRSVWGGAETQIQPLNGDVER